MNKEQANRQRKDLDAAYYSTFRNAHGRIVLDDLIKKYLCKRRPDADEMGKREMILEILDRSDLTIAAVGKPNGEIYDE